MNDLLATARRLADAADAARSDAMRAYNKSGRSDSNLASAARVARTYTNWTNGDLANARHAAGVAERGIDIAPDLIARTCAAMEDRFAACAAALAAIAGGDASADALELRVCRSGEICRNAWSEVDEVIRAARRPSA